MCEMGALNSREAAFGPINKVRPYGCNGFAFILITTLYAIRSDLVLRGTNEALLLYWRY